MRKNVTVYGYFFSSHSIVMNRDLTGISKQKDGSFVLKFTLTTTEKGITRTVSFKFYFIKPTLITFVTKKYININQMYFISLWTTRSLQINWQKTNKDSLYIKLFTCVGNGERRYRNRLLGPSVLPSV